MQKLHERRKEIYTDNMILQGKARMRLVRALGATWEVLMAMYWSEATIQLYKRQLGNPTIPKLVPMEAMFRYTLTAQGLVWTLLQLRLHYKHKYGHETMAKYADLRFVGPDDCVWYATARFAKQLVKERSTLDHDEHGWIASGINNWTTTTMRYANESNWFTAYRMPTGTNTLERQYRKEHGLPPRPDHLNVPVFGKRDTLNSG